MSFVKENTLPIVGGNSMIIIIEIAIQMEVNFLFLVVRHRKPSIIHDHEFEFMSSRWTEESSEKIPGERRVNKFFVFFIDFALTE